MIVIATIASEITDGINISFVIDSHCEWKRTTVEMQLWNFAPSRTLAVRWNMTPRFVLGLATPRLCGGPCCFLRGRDPSLFPPVVRLFFLGCLSAFGHHPLFSCLCPLRPLVPRFFSAWSLFGLVALAGLVDCGALPSPLGRPGPSGLVGLLPHLWRFSVAPWVSVSLGPVVCPWPFPWSLFSLRDHSVPPLAPGPSLSGGCPRFSLGERPTVFVLDTSAVVSARRTRGDARLASSGLLQVQRLLFSFTLKPVSGTTKPALSTAGGHSLYYDKSGLPTCGSSCSLPGVARSQAKAH